MKPRAACVLVGLLSLVLSLVPVTVAQTTAETTSALPRLVRFGGIVRDLNGNPLTGVVGITFALYSEETGGAALWLETQNVTADRNGHYVVLLGSTKPDGLPTELFTTEQARWVGVQVSGQPEQPRVLLVSAPYALKAGDAETIGGLPPSAFVLNAPVSGGRVNNGAPSSPLSSRAVPASSSDVTTTGGTVNTIPLFTTATNIQNSILTQIGTTAVSAAGNLTASGIVTGSSFQIGSNLFAFGSYANANAFLGFAGNSKTTGTSNTASGTNALLSNTIGSYNTANGYQALYSNTTGRLNTASGGGAMYSSISGYQNTAIGYGALYYNINGQYNTASGAFALYANTASYNTASGNGALSNNTIGFSNTAHGNNALGSNTTGYANTASGDTAMFDNLTGHHNTAHGNLALYQNTTGNFNTAIGDSALIDNSTGSHNTAVGYLAGSGVRDTSNNIEIGNLGAGSDSGVIRIGTAGTQTSAFIAGIYGVTTSTNNAVPVLIDSHGNLGTVSSSRRYKEDIQDMGDASSGLMRLRPVTFRYQKRFEDGSKPIQYGLIAEEVAEVYPDLVARSADGQIETVKYQLLDPMLLNEVQRQQAEIRELQERLSRMEAALAAVSHAPESR